MRAGGCREAAPRPSALRVKPGDRRGQMCCELAPTAGVTLAPKVTPGVTRAPVVEAPWCRLWAEPEGLCCVVSRAGAMARLPHRGWAMTPPGPAEQGELEGDLAPHGGQGWTWGWRLRPYRRSGCLVPSVCVVCVHGESVCVSVFSCDCARESVCVCVSAFTCDCTCVSVRACLCSHVTCVSLCVCTCAQGVLLPPH